MPLIVLKTPFIRHYTGSVFDLEENTENPNWAFEERISPKRMYLLPDNGKGLAVDLSVSDTVLCPPSVFEGIDLKTGPCRMTSVQTKSKNKDAVNGEWDLEKMGLFSINNVAKQGMKIELPSSSPPPQYLHLLDRKDNHFLKELPINNGLISIDLSDIHAGFYEIQVVCKGDIVHIFTFIKCFPLVVTIDKYSGNFTTTNTIW